MNLLLVNPVHPSTPHISGVRAWRFACELAGMGHRVVLLTATAPGGDKCLPLPVPETHDWREPLVLTPGRFAGAQPGEGWGVLRKLRTLWQLLRHGGYHEAWSKAAVASVEQLSPVFLPQMIWATVGKMESAFVARRLSRSLTVPWVLDLKDNWELYVPGPIRSAMARRLVGWSAVTANAGSTAADARRWHRAEPRIVYSGVDDAFFGAAGEREPAGPGFVINLIGSLYFSDLLQELLRGIEHWSRRLPEDARGRVEVRYIGSDVGIFDHAVEATGLGVQTHAGGYVPIDRMAASVRAAAINAYVVHTGSFHHKLLELLASGRPVMAFPGEGAESRALAFEVGGHLIEPGDSVGVARALEVLHQDWPGECHPVAAAPVQSPALRYSWNAQARLLEEVLVNAARK